MIIKYENILHLSDLHFGWEGKDDQKIAERDLALSNIIKRINNLEDDWKPTIVCITGDIGWDGKTSNYKEATKFIGNILTINNLEKNRLVICPGNHDVDRDIAKYGVVPKDCNHADDLLKVPVNNEIERKFEGYLNFCRDFGITPCDLGEGYTSYLYGMRKISTIEFITLNSAWFCKDNEDRGKLWLGYPQIVFLESKKLIAKTEYENENGLVITLIHHPSDYLHERELNTYNRRPPTWTYLGERTDLILSGHTHGGIKPPDKIAGRAYHISSGATFAGRHYFNSFRIIKLENDILKYKTFEYDVNASDKYYWKQTEIENLDLRSDKNKVHRETVSGIEKLVKDLREKSYSFSQNMIDRKSRLLKLEGKLPEITTRKVEKTDIQHILKRERNIDDNKDIILPIYEAVRLSRCSILLGDLGSGKSTICCQLVKETIDKNPKSMAFLIPIRQLRYSEPFRIGELTNSINDFILNQLLPGHSHIDIREMLNEGIEITLIFDGLDEIHSKFASTLLNVAYDLSNNWPNIQVLFSARPVEILGLDYTSWNILKLSDLTDHERIILFYNELNADENVTDKSMDNAISLLRKLKGYVSLFSIINTPLGVRLIYCKIQEFTSSSNKYSIGDIVYDLLFEIIGKWPKRSLKHIPYENFNSIYPSDEAKTELLSKIAILFIDNNPSAAEIKNIIISELNQTSKDRDCFLVANEALDYFSSTGILVLEDNIGFPLQAIYEMAAAIGIYRIWLENGNFKLNLKDWRIASFIATIMRREKQKDNIKSQLLDYIHLIIDKTKNVPASCYIVYESNNKEVATSAVSIFKSIGRRQIKVLRDEEYTSTIVIAKTIYLADDVGFNWFYDDYLHPKYPFIQAGSMLIENVFEAWASIAINSLTTNQQEKLKELKLPHQYCSPSLYILPIIATLIPDEFETNQRYILYRNIIFRRYIGDHVKNLFREAYRLELKDTVDPILLHSDWDSIEGILLWLEHNQGVPPKSLVVQKLLQGTVSSKNVFVFKNTLDQYVEKIEKDKYRRYLQWLLTDANYRISTAAAIKLFELGETDIKIVGSNLVDGIHDGGYIPSAYETLKSIIEKHGIESVEWLCHYYFNVDDSKYLHSAKCWELILENIDLLGEQGPEIIKQGLARIDEYLLARNPEIRNKFRILLEGKNANIYYRMMQESLTHPNPYLRRGAAMVLVTVFPEREALALYRVILARNGDKNKIWDEWEKFCLSLKFGPSALDFLKNKIPTLDSNCRIFAWAILSKNNYPLEASEEEELIKAISKSPNIHFREVDLGECSINSQKAYSILLKAIHSENDNLNDYAEQLIYYHSKNISPQDEVLCTALFYDWNSYQIKFSSIMEKISNGKYLNYLKEALDEMHTRKLSFVPLELLYDAKLDTTKWEKVLWSIFHNNSPSIFGVNEELILELIDYFKSDKSIYNMIGEAAYRILYDTRTQQLRSKEIIHWLGILVDDFVGLKEEDLENLIQSGHFIHEEAVCALIGRLGRIPKGFQCNRSLRHFSLQMSELSKTHTSVDEAAIDLESMLEDISKPSVSMHLKTYEILDRVLWEQNIDCLFINKIQHLGPNGNLISNFLSFFFESEITAINIVESIIDCNEQEYNRNNCYTRIYDAIMKHNHALVENNSDYRDMYIKALIQSLKRTEFKKPELTQLLLFYNKRLDTEQIGCLFENLIKYDFLLNLGLCYSICVWVSEEKDTQIIQSLISASERAIQGLNEKSVQIEYIDNRTHMSYLLFPMIIWKCTNKASLESIYVFLRGLKLLLNYIPENSQYQNIKGTPLIKRIYNIFSAIDPLVKVIPTDLLNKVKYYGLNSDDCEVRTIYKLFSSDNMVHPHDEP